MGSARAYINVLTPNDTLFDPSSQPHCAGSFAGAVASIAQRTDILREKSRNFAMAAISTVVTHQTGHAIDAARKDQLPRLFAWLHTSRAHGRGLFSPHTTGQRRLSNLNGVPLLMPMDAF